MITLCAAYTAFLFPAPELVDDIKARRTDGVLVNNADVDHAEVVFEDEAVGDDEDYRENNEEPPRLTAPYQRGDLWVYIDENGKECSSTTMPVCRHGVWYPSYEALRASNIERNNAKLKSLGLEKAMIEPIRKRCVLSKKCKKSVVQTRQPISRKAKENQGKGAYKEWRETVSST